jgi:hypothetical protein
MDNLEFNIINKHIINKYNMVQQTAVEYLLEKLYTVYRFEFSGTIVDEAKAMEREQIEKAIDEALIAYGIIKK